MELSKEGKKKRKIIIAAILGWGELVFILEYFPLLASTGIF